jgi:hypothetical protein
VTNGVLCRSRRTAKSDPRLGRQSLFQAEINEKLAEQLPLEGRGAYFTRVNMPPHWLDAILENQESYRRRQRVLL